jgi:transposase
MEALLFSTGKRQTDKSDQGYTGEKPALAAHDRGRRLQVVTLPEAKRGFVLLPRRRVVERSFAWTTRFRRLVRDYEPWPETLAGLHVLAFAVLMLHRFTLVIAHYLYSS